MQLDRRGCRSLASLDLPVVMEILMPHMCLCKETSICVSVRKRQHYCQPKCRFLAFSEIWIFCIADHENEQVDMACFFSNYRLKIHWHRRLIQNKNHRNMAFRMLSSSWNRHECFFFEKIDENESRIVLIFSFRLFYFEIGIVSKYQKVDIPKLCL